jgi:hypothetical protein
MILTKQKAPAVQGLFVSMVCGLYLSAAYYTKQYSNNGYHEEDVDESAAAPGCRKSEETDGPDDDKNHGY